MAKKEPYTPKDGLPRCGWVGDELDAHYHDTEWGVPTHDDQTLFELLILEGMQAGLSWTLILHRREGMRAALDGFDPAVIAEYGDAKLQELLQNPAMIRNRLKIAALVTNARAFLRVQAAFDTFDAYLWQYVNGTPIVNRWPSMADIPATTTLSDALSRDLKKRGFKFVGSTICYSFLQAAGLVNDHVAGCHFAPKDKAP